MTTTYSNKVQAAEVLMDGECLGLNSRARTCVRKTTDGLFAVIATVGTRLIRLFTTSDEARRYNSTLS